MPEQARIALLMKTAEEASPAMDRRNFLKQLVGAGVQFIDEVQQAGREEPCKVCDLDAYLKEKADGIGFYALAPSCKIRDSCSGCKICERNCPREALQIAREESVRSVFAVPLPRCESCGRVFQPIADAAICLGCNSRRKILK